MCAKLRKERVNNFSIASSKEEMKSEKLPFRALAISRMMLILLSIETFSLVSPSR